MNGGIAYLKLLMTVDHKHRHPPPHTHTLCEVTNMLIILILLIIPQYNVYQIIIYYTLNIHNCICQLFSDKVGGKTQVIISEREISIPTSLLSLY